MTLIDLYYRIKRDFEIHQREIISKCYSCNLGNSFDLLKQGESLYKEVRNTVLETRKNNELHYHNFLKHQLLSRLQEIKYYSTVDITNTRRLVSVSSDCITSIQILIRDVLHLNVYFRSSDFDGALPVDIQFICTIPQELINHLSIFSCARGYEEVTSELLNDLSAKPIKLNLMFGSLHRTI